MVSKRKGVYIVKNNKHVFAVIDELAVFGLDEIKISDIDDTCDKCIKFQKAIKANGCDENCPLYDIRKIKDAG